MGGPQETALSSGGPSGGGRGAAGPGPHRQHSGVEHRTPSGLTSPSPLPSPRPDLPRGRLTQPRLVPSPHGAAGHGCPRGHAAPTLHYLHWGGRGLRLPLPSRPVTTRGRPTVPLSELRAPATSPESRACVAGTGPTAGTGRSRGRRLATGAAAVDGSPASFPPSRGSAAPKAAGGFGGGHRYPSPLPPSISRP